MNFQIKANDIGLFRVGANDATLQSVILGVFLVIGSFAILYLIFASIRYVTSNGDQGQIAQAKNHILYAIIGLVISFAAFGIVQFVIGRF